MRSQSIFAQKLDRIHIHRAMVRTTQIGEVVAQHRDCFSIGNHHFFASNNDDLSLLNSLLISCEESG